jgi:hypothetical protein
VLARHAAALRRRSRGSRDFGTVQPADGEARPHDADSDRHDNGRNHAACEGRQRFAEEKQIVEDEAEGEPEIKPIERLGIDIQATPPGKLV